MTKAIAFIGVSALELAGIALFLDGFWHLAPWLGRVVAGGVLFGIGLLGGRLATRKPSDGGEE
jgi:hypothetical protein